MISVVLYGRNDSHGYNLHKRGAISLNCIAEMLDDADDEIIFVDYNSPDQIPTFPEAIADTLSEKVASLLRIIRVREGYHRQFTGETHLVALESQSRNIALRRANKANRWILSTNTDMIFVPRGENKSLTAAIGKLDDGFYHLPRFEIPENLWELFDRHDPKSTIAKVRKWGTELHLNEIVYGGYDNVFEAPGDFQLFLREDLERIGGFDEAMIRGWHVDSNIARRMKLLRGEVLSATEQVFGYHCGHTRQPTSLHRSGFVANSVDTFVSQVTDPVLRRQLSSWGAPDVVFEERRLRSAGSRSIETALGKAIPAIGPEISEVTLNNGSFDTTGYDPSHVLPHLVNLLGEMPPDQTVLLIGEDRSLFGQLAASLDGLGLRPKMLWADGDKKCAFAETLSLQDGIAKADLFVLQFPAHQDAATNSWRSRRWHAQQALEQIIAAERIRPQDKRRLVVLVNAAHTPLQHTFQPAMTFTAIPYTARLRHGFVALSQISAEQPERLFDYHADDIAMIRQLVSQDDAPSGWERLALELPDMIAQSGVEPAAAEKLLDAAARHVQASVRRCAVAPVRVNGRDVAATRLCSETDWENREWHDLADRCFLGNMVYSQGARSRWTWERVSLLHNLRSSVSENDRPWVLVVCNGADHLPAQVAHFGYRVAYVSYANLLSGLPENAANWENALNISHMISHPDIVPLDAALTRKLGRFAAVLIAGTDISAAGPERFAAVSARLAELVSDNAFVSFAVQVHLNKGTGRALSYQEWQAAHGPGGILAQMGMHPVGEFDPRIPLDCAVRFAPEDQSQYVPGLSFGWGDSMVTIGVINARRGALQGSNFAAPIAEDQSVEQAEQSAAPPFPAAVMDAANSAMQQNFACRVVPGVSRDLSQFAVDIASCDGLRWRLLALQLASGEELTVKLSALAAHVGLVDSAGLVTLAITGAASLALKPGTAGPSRQILVFATETDGPVTIEVA
jgi:hypothetical protein